MRWYHQGKDISVELGNHFGVLRDVCKRVQYVDVLFKAWQARRKHEKGEEAREVPGNNVEAVRFRYTRKGKCSNV